jgi:hypothetical protein
LKTKLLLVLSLLTSTAGAQKVPTFTPNVNGYTAGYAPGENDRDRQTRHHNEDVAFVARKEKELAQFPPTERRNIENQLLADMQRWRANWEAKQDEKAKAGK